MVFAYNISFTLLSHGRSNSCSHYSNVISGPGVCTSTIYTYTLLMHGFSGVLADWSAPCDNEAQLFNMAIPPVATPFSSHGGSRTLSSRARTERNQLQSSLSLPAKDPHQALL